MPSKSKKATGRHHTNVITSPTSISLLILLFVVHPVLRSHAFQPPAPKRAVLVKGTPVNFCGKISLCEGESARLSFFRRNINLYGTKHSNEKISESPDQISPMADENRLENNDEASEDELSSKEVSDYEETLRDEELENIKLEKEEKIEKEAVAQQVNQEKEELQAAVQEVKEAVVEVSQSAKNLGDAVINHGPGIFSRFFSLLVSEEMRYER